MIDQNKYEGANKLSKAVIWRSCIVHFWDMFLFGAWIAYNGIRTAFRGGRGPVPRPPTQKPPMGGEVNKPPHTPEGAEPARQTPARGHRTPGNNGGGPPTQAAARKLKPAPQRQKYTENPSPSNPEPQKVAWRNRPAGRART